MIKNKSILNLKPIFSQWNNELFRQNKNENEIENADKGNKCQKIRMNNLKKLKEEEIKNFQSQKQLQIQSIQTTTLTTKLKI